MADSDVEIVVNERVEGDAIEKVASASKDAANNAKELIKLIDSLSQTLEGINGDAAGQLRNELNELADIIKSMDIGKLQSLDGILEKMKGTKMKLTADGIKAVGDGLDKVEQKAKAVRKQISYFQNNVSVQQGDSTEETMGRKIGAMANAKSMVDTIQEYRAKLKEIPGDFKEIDKRLQYLMVVTRNAGPQSVDVLRRATENLTESFAGLGSQGQAALGELHSTIVSTSRSLRNNIQAPIREIEGAATETFSGANAMSAILSGNFQSLGSQLMGLVKKTKLWEAATQGVGGAAKGVGAAFVFAMFGISQGMKAVGNMLASARRGTENRLEGITRTPADQAEHRMMVLNLKNENARRSEALRDAQIKNRRTARDASLDAELSRLEAVKQTNLAGNYSAGGRMAIENAHADAVEQIGFQKEINALDDKEEDLTRSRDDIKRSIERMQAAQEGLSRDAVDMARAFDEVVRKGTLSDAWMGMLSMNGMTPKQFSEKVKEYAEKGLDARKMIADHQNTIRVQIMDAEAEVEKIESELGTITSLRDANIASQYAAQKARARRDAEIRREAEIGNRDRDVEIEKYQRAVAEEEEDRQYVRATEKADRATKLAMAQQRVKDREAENDKRWREYNTLMDANAGKDERDWDPEDLKKRSILEERAEHARQRLKSAQDELYRLERDGGSAEYGRQRDFDVERREEMEADRQQQRSWRTRRLGAAGRELDAKSEVDYQQQLLDERKKKLDEFVAARKKENGGTFSIEAMTEQQRAEFGNLRADYRESKGNVRSAKGAYMDVLWEGNQRAVDFRNGLKESNRLTAMGLAGGGSMKWGMDTANNTKELVRIGREVLKSYKDSKAGTRSESATYGF